MEAAMDLMRRMPPGSTETALNALLSLLPDHSLDLLSQVDLPLQVGNRRLVLSVSATCSLLIQVRMVGMNVPAGVLPLILLLC